VLTPGKNHKYANWGEMALLSLVNVSWIFSLQKGGLKRKKGRGQRSNRLNKLEGGMEIGVWTIKKSKGGGGGGVLNRAWIHIKGSEAKSLT